MCAIYIFINRAQITEKMTYKRQNIYIGFKLILALFQCIIIIFTVNHTLRIKYNNISMAEIISFGVQMQNS